MSQTQELQTMDRVLESVSQCLTPEAAQRLLDLRADAELQDRIDVLAERSTEGILTPEERAEYQTYVQMGQFVSILKAKARKLLAHAPPA